MVRQRKADIEAEWMVFEHRCENNLELIVLKAQP